jgi:hypothetical protein
MDLIVPRFGNLEREFEVLVSLPKAVSIGGTVPKANSGMTRKGSANANPRVQWTKFRPRVFVRGPPWRPTIFTQWFAHE